VFVSVTTEEVAAIVQHAVAAAVKEVRELINVKLQGAGHFGLRTIQHLDILVPQNWCQKCLDTSNPNINRTTI